MNDRFLFRSPRLLNGKSAYSVISSFPSFFYMEAEQEYEPPNFACILFRHRFCLPEARFNELESDQALHYSTISALRKQICPRK